MEFSRLCLYYVKCSEVKSVFPKYNPKVLEINAEFQLDIFVAGIFPELDAFFINTIFSENNLIF